MNNGLPHYRCRVSSVYARTAGLNMIDAVRALRFTFKNVSNRWMALGHSQGGEPLARCSDSEHPARRAMQPPWPAHYIN